MSKLTELFSKPLETAADELASKFKTPFFTTFIFVWIVRNRLFIYDMLFNTEVSIDRRDLLLKQFTFDKQFAWNSILTVLVSLGLIAIFYLAVNASRVITIFSEERIKLGLLQVLKSKRLSTTNDVDFWRVQVKVLENQVIKSQTETHNARSEFEAMETKIKDVETSYLTIKSRSEEHTNVLMNLRNKTPSQKQFNASKNIFSKEFNTFVDQINSAQLRFTSEIKGVDSEYRANKLRNK